MKIDDIYTDKEMFLHLMKKLGLEEKDITKHDNNIYSLLSGDTLKIGGYTGFCGDFTFDEGGNIIEMSFGE